MNPGFSRVWLIEIALCFAPLCFGQSALPNPADLLKDARSRQEKMDAIRENYTFHRIVTTDELDDRGAVTKSTSEEHEVFFVNGHRIARLVKKNGTPLDAAAEKKEQERIRKRVEECLKQAPPPRRGAGTIAEILAVVKISNPRRLTLNGRSTLAYDFTGDPAAHGHDMEQNAMKKTSGTLWFDEVDHQVARLEVLFYDNFRIAGGLLANVQKGTSISLEQSPVGDGLWMQTASEQHVGVRVAFKKYRENEHARNFDFKKFDVTTQQQIVQH
jgi:hypothetical protein